jgi:catechol 2,3-dioxygenase-like lactoylglutathione lyase family enzyme
MIDHLSLYVESYARAKEFYLAALLPLRYSLSMEFPMAGGFGVDGKPDLWIVEKPASKFATHICLRAENRAQVDAFYTAAIAAGAKDNGKPGLRAEYHANYYGAFVIDPDGNNLEAVCHEAVK